MDNHTSSSACIIAGFTPVRRKEETINQGRTEANSEPEWTTARCHRLLRALTSRVAILSKEISKYSSKRSRQELVKKPNRFPLSTTRTQDDDWLHPRKKVKQTYSGRGRGTSGKARLGRKSRMGPTEVVTSRSVAAPGDVAVPTPLLARARGVEHISDEIPESPLREKEAPPRRRRKLPLSAHPSSRPFSWEPFGTLYDVRQKVDGASYTAYEGIFTGLDTLIRSTNRDRDITGLKRKGARSLFDIASRSIPRYIAEQEEAVAAYEEGMKSRSAITTRDISTEIYDELESLGTSGKHWKHLKVVVRSHGIRIICDAIQEQLLDAHFVGVLISLLVDWKAFDEADELVAALVTSSSFNIPKTLYDPMDHRITMLTTYAAHTQRFAFLYRQLSQILANEALPPQWLATKTFSSIWTLLIQHVSIGPSNLALLFQFLATALPALAQLACVESDLKAHTSVNIAFADASKNSLSSILTTLSSIYILGDEACKLDKFGLMKEFEYDGIEYMLRSSYIQSQSCGLQPLHSLPFFVLSKLLESKGTPDMTLLGARRQNLNLHELVSSTLDITNAVQNTAFLVSNIARCCGRGASSSGFEYLQELHLVLDSLEKDTESTTFINTIIVDSAYNFAQAVPHRQHDTYAVQIDRRFPSRVKSLGLTSGSPTSNNSRIGFRWEEGIGEWVTATPAVALAKRMPALRISNDDDEDTEYESPVRPRRIHRELSPPLTLLSSDGASPAASPKDAAEAFSHCRRVNGRAQAIAKVSDSLSSDVSASDNTESSDEDSKGVSSLDVQVRKEIRKCAIRKQPFRLKQRRARTSNHLNSSDSSQCSTKSRKSLSEVQSKRSGEVMVFVDRNGSAELDLRLSHKWHDLNESDDELSFVSVSSGSSQIMREVTSNRIERPRVDAKASKLKKRRFIDLLSGSEDELGLL